MERGLHVVAAFVRAIGNGHDTVRIWQQNHGLLAFAFSKPKPRGKTIEYPMRSPVDLKLNLRSFESWLGD